ncbi:MAG: L-serine ammonia-lyase, iron-sulfur-dependent, subunit alpha [Candidatus Fimivivens sp.]
MYGNFDGMLNLAEKNNLPLWEVILENEKKHTDTTEDEIFKLLQKRYEVMEASAYRALKEPMPTVLGLVSGISSAQNRYAEQKGGLCGALVNKAMAYALSCSEVNASMGKICAAPTAGACGILPAVLLTLKEALSLTQHQTLCGLLTAAGVGAVIMKNATVSGAEGGCQAECGVAAAMAAAAAVELTGGHPRQALDAVCFALMNSMGLVCDPVAGLVQVPCAQRNASQTVNALLSADLALASMTSVIPTDEVVNAMYQVGRQLPMQLRETAMGGIAATDAANKLTKQLFELA